MRPYLGEEVEELDDPVDATILMKHSGRIHEHVIPHSPPVRSELFSILYPIPNIESTYLRRGGYR